MLCTLHRRLLPGRYKMYTICWRLARGDLGLHDSVGAGEEQEDFSSALRVARVGSRDFVQGMNKEFKYAELRFEGVYRGVRKGAR
jgi:hypothetical protein